MEIAYQSETLQTMPSTFVRTLYEVHSLLTITGWSLKCTTSSLNVYDDIEMKHDAAKNIKSTNKSMIMD